MMQRVRHCRVDDFQHHPEDFLQHRQVLIWVQSYLKYKVVFEIRTCYMIAQDAESQMRKYKQNAQNHARSKKHKNSQDLKIY